VPLATHPEAKAKSNMAINFFISHQRVDPNLMPDNSTQANLVQLCESTEINYGRKVVGF
jgi:hypothetical protein